MSQSKNIHAQKFYGTASDIKNSVEKLDIRMSDENSLMTKARALKSLPTMIYLYKFKDKV